MKKSTSLAGSGLGEEIACIVQKTDTRYAPTLMEPTTFYVKVDPMRLQRE
jgi:hypothetical protein